MRKRKGERRAHIVTSMRLVRTCRNLLLLLLLGEHGTASRSSTFPHLDFVKENNLEPGVGVDVSPHAFITKCK